jgi:hypothetical protein
LVPQVGLGADSPSLGKSTVTKPSEPMEETKIHKVIAPMKKKKKKYIYSTHLLTGARGSVVG